MLKIKPKILSGYFILILSMPLNKFLIRPWVIEQGISNGLLIIVNSYPNFIEAVSGTLLLTGLAFWARSKGFLRGLNDRPLYWLTTIAAGIYVITQELKIHNLGGQNIYDPYDIVASVLGLVVINRILMRSGMFESDGPGEAKTSNTR